MLRTVTLGVLIILSCSAFSDQDDLVKATQSAFEQALKHKVKPVPDSLSNQALQSSIEAISNIKPEEQGLPIMPNPELFNSIPNAPPIDIGDLANQGKGIMGSVYEQESRYETQVLVFISSSMPDTTVKNYIQHSRKIGAGLVLRGLVNDSLTDTKIYLHRVLEQAGKSEHEPSILIDPTLYERFGINQVPTIVVTESQVQNCSQQHCPTPKHHKVSGDVSLAWALSLVTRQVENTDLKSTLRPLIKDMERL